MKSLLKSMFAGTPLEPILQRGVRMVRGLGRSFASRDARVRKMRDLWNTQSRESRLGYISHLRSGEWDKQEFALVGDRFVAQIVERLQRFGRIPLAQATVLEIGCGVGRFLRPMAGMSSQVIGVDISDEMLATAREYCQGLTNARFVLNDGTTLTGVADESVDYVFSAGVFQHITDRDVTLAYIREAARVLKPGGIFLFQFEGSRTEQVGAGQLGARITARDLDVGLRGVPFRVREVSTEQADPIRNLVCVVEKGVWGQVNFMNAPIVERPWLLGVYDDIRTQTVMHDRLREAPMRLTFHD